ncbi:hemolysin family protein [Aquifex aeolicus]|uniref:Hemolysin n=1 Tax=Aquifex aeolicus (strain VF5) TaxID=224324 RepID=O66507_AQUAE|nr:hemolysin family protein [Aquifex aeolicus]AAC06463.1 hemolysin [Aquifex aeolicus VF5]
MELIGFLIGVFFFIILEGFFAGSEIALVNADKGFLKAVYKKKKYSFLKHFLDSPEEYITLTMLGYTVSIVFASALYTLFLMNLSKYVPEIKGKEVLLAETLVIFTIILGEIIPKSLFQHYADKVVIPSLYILDKLRIVLKPFLVLAKAVSRFISSRFAKGESKVRREDIIKLLREKKSFSESLGYVISNILSFKERRIGEIVRPLYEVVMIPDTATVLQAIEQIKKSGYARIPVYRKRVDDIIGYVSAYDLIDKPLDEPIKSFIRRILIFSEFTPLPKVLEVFKEKKEHIALVVDERGVILGIVTLEDIFREILGDFISEKGEEPLVREVSKDTWVADGKVEINELRRITGINIPDGPYNTLSGFIAYQLGRIPKKGDVVSYDGYNFKVVDGDTRRVRKVLIERKVKKKALSGASA